MNMNMNTATLVLIVLFLVVSLLVCASFWCGEHETKQKTIVATFILCLSTSSLVKTGNVN